jgi:acyl-CoA synthetase (AMP-forming)/AMP-acid ligase II
VPPWWRSGFPSETPRPQFPAIRRFVRCGEEIIASGRDRIARFKAPKQVPFVDRLPMTPTGKVRECLFAEPFAKAAKNL